MLDITLCSGGNCPTKQNCYRHTAEFFGRQDFFGSPPYATTIGHCDYFLSNIEQIRKQAYLIWLAKGSPEGQDEAIWIEAEKEITKY
ncbi:MAG: DUF2934 domain-containing protein [Cytophagales bacterium]|nr:MAG: DUF2934 domain-containing protein [Cytophagales bacterium]